MSVVTPSDSPKLVRNRCVIESFGDVFVLSCCPFDISVDVGAFVIGLSQISSFFLVLYYKPCFIGISFESTFYRIQYKS